MVWGQSLYRFCFWSLNFVLGCFIWLLFIVAIECMPNLGINSLDYLGISNTWMYGSKGIVFPDGLCSVPIVTMRGVFFTLCVLCLFSSLIWSLLYKAFFKLQILENNGIEVVCVCIYVFTTNFTNVLVKELWCFSFVVEDESLRLFLAFVLLFCFIFLLPHFYCTNWNTVQSSAELLTIMYFLL